MLGDFLDRRAFRPNCPHHSHEMTRDSPDFIHAAFFPIFNIFSRLARNVSKVIICFYKVFQFSTAFCRVRDQARILCIFFIDRRFFALNNDITDRRNQAASDSATRAN